MSTPDEILLHVLERASANLNQPFITDSGIQQRVEYVCRQVSNRACTRLLMACSLARIDRPEVDPRKPYTEIGSSDAFSGRSYDEKYITRFIHTHRLPLNATTAFLTPAFRNLNQPLTPDIELMGRPRALYKVTLELLEDVYQGRVTAEDLLTEIVRILLVMREEKQIRIASLMAGLSSGDTLPLATEEIITLLEQHLKCKNSSRLPVLMIAAVYKVIGEKLGERARPLQSHTAADLQTGSLGDLEITLENDDRVVTVYEMKTRRVTIEDIDQALEKIARASPPIHHYLFITTDVISEDVRSYAATCYERTHGTEIAVLDCIGFVRHFLHLFYRFRAEFLEAYQTLVLNEPDSAVNQALKEAFLVLRQTAEADRD